jgi:hypothetical protein
MWNICVGFIVMGLVIAGCFRLLTVIVCKLIIRIVSSFKYSVYIKNILFCIY